MFSHLPTAGASQGNIPRLSNQFGRSCWIFVNDSSLLTHAKYVLGINSPITMRSYRVLCCFRGSFADIELDSWVTWIRVCTQVSEFLGRRKMSHKRTGYFLLASSPISPVCISQIWASMFNCPRLPVGAFPSGSRSAFPHIDDSSKLA